MNMLNSKQHYYLTGLAALLICLALPAGAQPRTGGGGGGGGGLGGGARTSTSSGTSRTYPANGAIGDAYYSIDPESRRVVVIADADTSMYVSQVLSNLDRPKPQVLIKVVFIEVTHNKASDLGLEGGYGKSGMNGTISAANAANVFGLGGLTGTATNQALNALGQPISSFVPVSPMTQTGAGLYQMLGQDYQVTLRAIAQAGNARILSRPSILARNNQPATITVGQSVPLITSVSYNGLNGTPINAYQYESVGVILKVTPFITSDGLVEMIVSPQISSIDSTTAVPIGGGATAPVINIRSADTVAVTPDGQTVVIGGLMQNTKADTVTKIPVLGDIPLLGNLFKRSQKADSRSELIIFLTPHIVQAPSQLVALSDGERQRSTATKEYSEDELNKIFDTLPAKDPGTGAATKPAKKKSGSPDK